MLDLDIINDDIIRGIYAIKINFDEVSSSLIWAQRPKSVNVIPEISNENLRIVSVDESANTSFHNRKLTTHYRHQCHQLQLLQHDYIH